ncbi:ribosomal RNA small subunit methyltransferase A [Clostridium tepidiprofundi DSM 19306]|uniref:Ribosomal RNA small subunit methyltransferase A n=1 Tax=Clostridium tepidiprofundi DSM 19306 TaxID=1121338 RepID=A0A151B2L7_9CLOT|nr:16S rRNA (adenine(1518)-N(6)/adenine(1519)-N(6))-dimethyltransferase RsmA [Clostridium tepidiprofundi]KYH34148.1 ribosomal RNA small subunit methyltransferase A [Clostridium tepidiprofundi DSM 19306]
MGKLTTSDIVKKYNFRFTKSLGQNFLTDESVLMDIVESANITKDDFVIEIGPGVGTLTNELLKRAKFVYAIELDSKLIPILQQELGIHDNFKIINEDALKVDFNEIIGNEESVKVVANLPYYVTTPIISKFLTEGYNFKSLTIMIQKEVAERINAEPGTKEYGALTLLAQYYCDTEIIRKVPASAFIPSPKVDSIVIKLNKLSKPKVSVKSEKLFFKVVKQSFSMRRKTLWNGMKNIGLNKEMLMEAFQKSDIDPKRRGETLTIQEFANLSNSIYELLN